MENMNRRRFIQSIAVAFSLPAASNFTFRTATAAVPKATVVPAQVRSWAIYLSTLHGECTPVALQNLLNIPAVDAKNYVTQLAADGVIRSHPLLQKSAYRVARTKDSGIFDKLKKRLELKAQTDPNEIESARTSDSIDALDPGVDLEEDAAESQLENSSEDESVEVAAQETDQMAIHGRSNSPSQQ